MRSTASSSAIAKGETRPNAVKLDPGFALSAENYDFKGANTWGCMVLDAKVGFRSAGRAGIRFDPARPSDLS